MKTLTFPHDGEDMEAAFNSGLSQGVFGDDATKPTFWGLFEFLGSVTEDDGPLIDVFKQQHTLAYVRIERTKHEAAS